MPIYDRDTQPAANIVTQDPTIVSGEMAELLQGPFSMFVQLRRVEVSGGAANFWQINRGDTSGWVNLVGRHYIPPFVVRGISTNDKDADGETAVVDLSGDTNALNLEIRLFSGLDRPYRVTRVHLHRIMQDDDINSITLTG